MLGSSKQENQHGIQSVLSSNEVHFDKNNTSLTMGVEITASSTTMEIVSSGIIEVPIDTLESEFDLLMSSNAASDDDNIDCKMDKDGENENINKYCVDVKMDDEDTGLYLDEYDGDREIGGGLNQPIIMPIPTVSETSADKIKVTSSSFSSYQHKNKRNRSTSASSNNNNNKGEEQRKKKRNTQILAALRSARARKKRELDELREENKILKEKKSIILTKVKEFKEMARHLKEREEEELKAENQKLKEQIEDHVRLVNLFKSLCDGAPKLTNGKHIVCKQGSDEAQTHLLNLLFQSQTEQWKEALSPDQLKISSQRIAIYYKYEMEDSKEGEDRVREKRFSVRIDVLYPSTDATNISEFFWGYLTSSKFIPQLFGVKGVEVTDIVDDMPDKDTKLLYYREKNSVSGKDVDWSIVCCRRTKELLKSSILPPNKSKCNDNYFPSKPQSDKIKSIVTALTTTTKQSITPQFEDAERINSEVFFGCVSWNVGDDARASMIVSFPDDFSIKPVEGMKDFIDENGYVAMKLARALGNAQQVIIEHSADIITEPITSA